MRSAAYLLMLSIGGAIAQPPDKPNEPLYKFGTTVVATTGFRGQVYHIRHDSMELPDLTKLKPRGNIYTPYLYVPAQDFKIGFPGVTRRFEWFAIDYTGRFWIATPGRYVFALASDDGSLLFIDGNLLVDNNGLHSVMEKEGDIQLDAGIHRVRVAYYQGPRSGVALMLRVRCPAEKEFHVFNLDEFKPPPDAQWTYPVEEPKKRKR